MWRRFKNWLLGRTYFIGMDPAGADGDYSAIVRGYRDRRGIFHIESVETTNKKEGRTNA